METNTDTPARPPTVTEPVPAAVRRFIDTELIHLADSARKNQGSLMRKFGREHAHMLPCDVTPAAVAIWCQGDNADTFSANYIRKRYAILRKFFRWCLAEGLTPTDPAAEASRTQPRQPTTSSKRALREAQQVRAV